MTVTLHQGNCLEIIPTLPDCSIDSIVTDPPYELGFMGKKWDASGIAYNVTLWQECLRVLKPGGHLLAFGGTRTYHRMACAIEDAGFEIRDSIHWLYGSGFPKSLDVSKAIDKAAGVEFSSEPASGVGFMTPNGDGGYNFTKNKLTRAGDMTEDARTWEGWGTALKPSHEPIVVARKPVVGTVASNVLTYGTGALNIDATRIGGEPSPSVERRKGSTTHLSSRPAAEAVAEGRMENRSSPERFTEQRAGEQLGRWPANTVLSHLDDCGDECAPGCAVAELDRQSDGGSRFFYCAKPSRRERNAGLDDLPDRELDDHVGQLAGKTGSGNDRSYTVKNNHPTVKPLALMRYLIRLVTPPNGNILEPFAGSGTTLMAATLEGFHAIGIEMTDEYLPIIEGRIAWAEQQALKQQEELEL